MKNVLLTLFLCLMAYTAFGQAVPTPFALASPQYCEGVTKVYGPQTIVAAETYTWTITPAIPFTFVPGTSGAQIEVLWDTPGVYTITQTADNGVCTAVFTGQVTIIANGVMPPVVVTQCITDLDVVIPGAGCTYTPTAGGSVAGSTLTVPGLGTFPVNITCTDPVTGCSSTGLFTLVVINAPGGPIFTN